MRKRHKYFAPCWFLYNYGGGLAADLYMRRVRPRRARRMSPTGAGAHAPGPGRPASCLQSCCRHRRCHRRCCRRCRCRDAAVKTAWASRAPAWWQTGAPVRQSGHCDDWPCSRRQPCWGCWGRKFPIAASIGGRVLGASARGLEAAQRCRCDNHTSQPRRC